MYQGRGHSHSSSRQMPRGFWRLGKVETIIQGRDKNVRSTTVKVVSPNGKLTVINRPLSKLYPVEVETDVQRLLLTLIWRKLLRVLDQRSMDVQNVPPHLTLMHFVV